MALLSESTFVKIAGILIAFAAIILTYFKWAFKYWERKNLPYAKPSFPFGTMSNPFRVPLSFGEQTRIRYNEFKARGAKHGGLYGMASPIYIPVHPDYIKNVMSKDFNHFIDRGFYINEQVDPLSAHLFSLEGSKWRNIRMKLTPTFTSGKMKMMFETLIVCGSQMKAEVDRLSKSGGPVNIKDILGRFTTDVIGSCAFGLDCNSFKEQDSDFIRYAKRVFVATKFETFKGFFQFSFPNLCRSLGMRLTPVEVQNFFINVTKNTAEFREKNNVVRNDFMQLLLELKNTKNEDFTIEQVAAQAFVFFLAGYETSSTTMMYFLFELALNQEIQEKVREEVNAVLENHNGKLTYDATTEMKYMGQVIDETLRKYPPVPALNRKCLEDYKVPGTDVTIEKGTGVVISVLGLHHDPDYFPDPETFDPDRFDEKNKSKINSFTYMPFGEGPRICIGLRFGVMQTKVGLAILLKNYRFSMNSRTKIPLEMNPFSFVFAPLGDIWLNVERIGE